MPWLDSSQYPPLPARGPDDPLRASLGWGPERWLRFSDRLSGCARALRETFGQMAETRQVSLAGLSILWACREAIRAGASQTELARGLALSAANVSGQVEQLRRQGLLEGRRPAADRRRQVWRLTAAGEALCQGVARDLTLWARGLEEHLGGEAGEVALWAVEQLWRALRAEPGTGAAADADRKGAA